MVIILQQSSDNGHRFISTVVEEDLAALAAAEAEENGGGSNPSGVSSVDDADALNFGRDRDRDPPQGASSCASNTNTSRSTQSNCSSSFSLTSQHSISERSAIYKRRIDSLFGRQSKFNSFKPHMLESFRVKVEGEAAGFGVTPASLPRRHSYRGPVGYSKGILLNGAHRNSEYTVQRPKQLRLLVDSSDDDDGDDYENVLDENHNFSSVVTDSLINLPRFNQAVAQTQNNNLAKQANARLTNQNQNRFGLGRNVTSVRITCDENDNELSAVDNSHDSRVHSEFRRLCDKMGENAMALSDKAAATRNGVLKCSNGNSNGSAPCSSNSADLGWRNGDYAGTAQLPCASPSSSYPSEKERFNSPNLIHACDLRFSVEYLGRVPVEGNTTALEDLQAPLCSLYTNYLNGRNVQSGQLAITKEGLRFESPKLRLVNPFATIAVWAAIKFVARGEPHPVEFAFMPLISDPEGQDKGRLFGAMGDEFARIYRNKCEAAAAGGHDGNGKLFRNPPLFACVMREASFSLDCHAFVCRCAEDAIVVAANLYQSLVDKMKCNRLNPNMTGNGKREGESGYGTLTRNSPANQTNTQSPSSAFSTPSCSPPLLSSNPQCQFRPGIQRLEVCCNQVGCGINAISCPSGICQDSEHSPDGVCSDSESLLIPIRPPRKNNKKKQHQHVGAGKSNLKRYNSEDSVLLKVPQRRASINKARNCSQAVGYRPQYIKNTKRVKISTPEEELSSSSSGPDFQLSDSIDQVLDRIINPGGMSFNDLKPSYQQLLLKIALTLTQDQLYQKSKDAMKKHQTPLRGVGKQKANGKRKSHETTVGIHSEEQSQFLGAFLKSFSRITSGKMMTSGASSTPSPMAAASSSAAAVAASASKTVGPSKGILSSKLPSKLPRKIILKKSGPAVPPKPVRTRTEEASMMSFCSGCACANCSEKCYCSLPSKQNPKIIRIPAASTPTQPGKSGASSPAVASTSSAALKNDSKHCSRSASEHEAGTEHVTCVPSGARAITTKMCGYDTLSCAGSEKCYCSLQRVKSNGLKIYNINLDTETSDTDTTSYDLEAFNPTEPTTTTSSSSNLKTVSTKSVEVLSYHPARRLSYCSGSNGANSPASASIASGSPNPQPSRFNNVPLHTTNATVHHQQPQKSGPGSSVMMKGQLRANSDSNQQPPYFHSSPTPKGILCNSSYNKSNQAPGNNNNKVRLVTGPGQDAGTEDPTCSKYAHAHAHAHQERNVPKGKIYRKNITDAHAKGNCVPDICDGRANENARGNESSGSGCEAEKVISMKKTAEIAAMFKDLHLNRQHGGSNSKANGVLNGHGHEVLNIVNAKRYDTNSDNNNITTTPGSSTDFQASLGYLP